MKIGERIKAIRVAGKETQEQLGRMVGVTNMTISKIERGDTEEPDPSTVRGIADYFDISLDVLYGRTTGPLEPGPGYVRGTMRKSEPAAEAGLGALAAPEPRVERDHVELTYAEVEDALDEAGADDELRRAVHDQLRAVRRSQGLTMAYLRGVIDTLKRTLGRPERAVGKPLTQAGQDESDEALERAKARGGVPLKLPAPKGKGRR